MLIRIALLSVLLTTSCTCKSGDQLAPPAPRVDPLIADAMRALAERDRLISSYHVMATTTEGAFEAKSEFFFKSPNQSRGQVSLPDPLELSFDGTRLYKLLPKEKRLEIFEFKISPEKASMVLIGQFAPFVPEGYRTPLIPWGVVKARKLALPKAPDAVELTVVLPDESGSPVMTSWTLRMPAGDFLSKRISNGAQVRTLTVDEEQCDEKLHLCVPVVLTERENEQVVDIMKVTTLEMNVPLAKELFAIEAPLGFSSKQRVIEEAEPKPQ